MLIKPMIRNSICMTAHPEGCRRQVRDQIAFVKRSGRIEGAKSALIIGSSTGYGLASRIVSAFGCHAPTVGVFYERPGSEKRSATAGWYNTVAFDAAAADAGIASKSINGDAFSDEIKEAVIEAIRKRLGSVDLVIYSLASPVRTDPESGETYRSVIKPIGESFTSTTADPFTGELSEFTIEPATETEIAETVKVMGGEDWIRWIDRLVEAGVLGPGTRTVAYSYIGPPATQSMYRHGTIGRAKEDLERSAHELTTRLAPLGGSAYVSVNKALVTRASAVIPVVPLYISLLYKVMKEKKLHENCIDQIYRLFSERLYAGVKVPVDEEGRIRMDDYEMRPDVQAEVAALWNRIGEVDPSVLADFEGYRKTFLEFHGFGVDGVDYEVDVAP